MNSYAYYMNLDDNMDYSRNAPFVKTEEFMPTIFAFSLGTVEYLRGSLGIPKKYADDYLVVKYGYTKDFAFTARTLEKKYEHIDNVDLLLLHHNYVDQAHIFMLDKRIRLVIGGHRYKPYNNGEFIIISSGEMERYYLTMCNQFKGKNRFFINKINDLQAEMEKNRLKTTVDNLNSMMEINHLKAVTEKNRLKAELDKHDSSIENIKLKKDMMVMEQQLIDQKKIIEVFQRSG